MTEHGKYTPEQLSDMAVTTIQAIEAGDPRGQFLVAFLCAEFGMGPAECVERIKAFIKEAA